MKLIVWNELTSVQQAAVRRAYVHWHYDTTVTTFEEWAAKHAFYVKKNGKLSQSHRHCEPAYLARGR